MSRHSTLTGSDLHISVLNTNAGTPIGAVTPGNTGEPIYDTTNDNFYISNSTTNTSWQLIFSQLITTQTPSGTTVTMEFDETFNHVLDLGSASGNVTITLDSPIPGMSYVIKIIQSATARTLVWPATVFWPSGTAPTISTGNDEVDIITLFWDGTNYFGNSSLNYS